VCECGSDESVCVMGRCVMGECVCDG